MENSNTQKTSELVCTQLPQILQEQSKYKNYCPCGEVAVFWEVAGRIIWGQKCVKCNMESEKIRKAEHEKEKPLRIREVRRTKKNSFHEQLERIIPPLYKNAHLRRLSTKLKNKMLSLKNERGLVFYGPPGVGKSYAMCVLMRQYILEGASVIRNTYDRLCLEIRDTYTKQASELSLLERYQTCDKLFIEDIGTTIGVNKQESDFSLRTFLAILDYRIENMLPTFITTNKSIEEISKSFDERIASRLRGTCEILPVYGKDKRISV